MNEHGVRPQHQSGRGRSQAGVDGQPHRDPSQMSTLHKIGRLAAGFGISLIILLPLGWLVFG
jgi:hypothetical protein